MPITPDGFSPAMASLQMLFAIYFQSRQLFRAGFSPPSRMSTACT